MIENAQYKDAVYIYGDIRGFTKWSIRNQTEISELIDKYYEIILNQFRNTSELRREKVIKFLGDGFFAVVEFDKTHPNSLSRALFKAMIKCQIVYSNFVDFKEKSTLHNIDDLGIGFGITYGNCLRFNLPGNGIDYIGEKVNYAARLCGAAQTGQIYTDQDVRKQLDDILDDVTEIYEEGIVNDIPLKGYSNTAEPEKIYAYKLRKTRKKAD